MKILLKEWMKNPKGFVISLLRIFTQSIGILMSSMIMIKISEMLNNPSTWKSVMPSVIVMAFIEVVMGWMSSYCKKRGQLLLANTLILDYSTKIVDADINMFTKYSAAHINSVGQFSFNVARSLGYITEFIVSMISIVITLYFMNWIEPGILISMAIIYLVGGVMTKLLYKKFSKYDIEWDKTRRKRNQAIEDIVQGFVELRIFNKQEYHKRYMRGINDKAVDLLTAKGKLTANVGALFIFISDFAMIFVTIFSIVKIIKGELTPVYAMTLLSFSGRLMNPIVNMVDLADILSEELALKDEYAKIMAYKNETIRNEKVDMADFDDDISINDVSFSYGNSSNVLMNISLHVKKGEKIGICGVSGGGKSSLFKLVNRFYDPDQGSIKIDGIDIKDITEKSFRRLIGSVNQENYIFSGSIKDNITYAVNRYTEDELIDACKKANIYEFIIGLDDKFDTLVGPRGLKLSGGQKQRIALARVMLQNPEIILLDEATSALDNETEKFVQESIENIGSDKTVITVAHRLSTIQNCDRIYVMKNKKIVESGTHDELVKEHGEYYRMLTSNQK